MRLLFISLNLALLSIVNCSHWAGAELMGVSISTYEDCPSSCDVILQGTLTFHEFEAAISQGVNTPENGTGYAVCLRGGSIVRNGPRILESAIRIERSVQIIGCKAGAQPKILNLRTDISYLGQYATTDNFVSHSAILVNPSSSDSSSASSAYFMLENINVHTEGLFGAGVILGDFQNPSNGPPTNLASAEYAKTTITSCRGCYSTYNAGGFNLSIRDY